MLVLVVFVFALVLVLVLVGFVFALVLVVLVEPSVGTLDGVAPPVPLGWQLAASGWPLAVSVRVAGSTPEPVSVQATWMAWVPGLK